MNRIKNYCKLLGLVFFLLWKRIRYRQLYYLISTPYYGNVGDHTIELAEQEMLLRLGMKKRMIDINSYEYGVLKKILVRIIRNRDIILIDGGGNFGDTWPETQKRINDILRVYQNNRILIFPESWYFSDSEKGRLLLNKTKRSLENCKYVILYARDGWSYDQMKKSLNGIEIRLAYDCVFYKEYLPKDTNNDWTVVGLSLREDRESKNVELKRSIIGYLNGKHVKHISIHNDSYDHIKKNEREDYFDSIVKLYEECTVVITDRFHGLIFSIITRRPCLFYDNSTGKIAHFYEDIKDVVNGCIKAESSDFNKSEIDQILDSEKLTVTDLFLDTCNEYRKDIEAVLNEWRTK